MWRSSFLSAVAVLGAAVDPVVSSTCLAEGRVCESVGPVTWTKWPGAETAQSNIGPDVPGTDLPCCDGTVCAPSQTTSDAVCTKVIPFLLLAPVQGGADPDTKKATAGCLVLGNSCGEQPDSVLYLDGWRKRREEGGEELQCCEGSVCAPHGFTLNPVCSELQTQVLLQPSEDALDCCGGALGSFLAPIAKRKGSTGDRLHRYNGVSDPEECAQFCLEKAGCRSFSIKTTSNGLCQLFGSGPSTKEALAKAWAHSYYAMGFSCAGTCSHCPGDGLANFDAPLHFTKGAHKRDLLSTIPDTASASVCAIECLSVAGCLSFSRSGSGVCRLYDNGTVGGTTSVQSVHDHYIRSSKCKTGDDEEKQSRMKHASSSQRHRILAPWPKEDDKSDRTGTVQLNDH